MSIGAPVRQGCFSPRPLIDAGPRLFFTQGEYHSVP